MLTTNFFGQLPITSGAVLKYKVRPAKSNTETSPLLVLLHGVGSNENDLYRLADFIDEDFLVVFARAPYTHSVGRYKWYDVDFKTGKPILNEEQAQVSLMVLDQFIQELKLKHKFDHNKIIVGGFSQGAIMSYSLALTKPGVIAGIISLSGRILMETNLNVNREKVQNLNALVIHGVKDQVLPITYARTAKKLLDKYQVKVSYYELQTGHTINQEVIIEMNKWLKDRK